MLTIDKVKGVVDLRGARFIRLGLFRLGWACKKNQRSPPINRVHFSAIIPIQVLTQRVDPKHRVILFPFVPAIPLAVMIADGQDI